MEDDLILKKATVYSLLLMIIVFLISMCLRPQNDSISFAGENALSSIEIINKEYAEDELHGEETISWKSTDGKDYSKISEKLDDKYIIIEKPEYLNEAATISLEDISVDRKIIVTIKGLEKSSKIHTKLMVNSSSEGMSSDLVYSNTAVPSDIVKVLSVIYTQLGKDEASQLGDLENYSIQLTYELNTTYAYLIFEDEHNYYISLLKPKDIYDRIIVLDAGHGGLDCGTYSEGYEYLEKDMNLSMLLYLKEYLEKEDIKIYYTRTEDNRLTLPQRVALANAVEADLFLSIHCNSSLKPEVNGIEVLYNDSQDSWSSFNSKQFSEICLEEMVRYVPLNNRGIRPRSQDVLIIGNSEVPVALVEVGFMSNSEDLSFLIEDKNKKIAAEGMYHAILRAYDVLEQGNNNK